MLLSAAGSRVEGRSLLLLLIKASAMAVCLFGMNLAANRGTALLRLLAAQEVALFALLYLAVLAAVLLRLGRRDAARELASTPGPR